MMSNTERDSASPAKEWRTERSIGERSYLTPFGRSHEARALREVKRSRPLRHHGTRRRSRTRGTAGAVDFDRIHNPAGPIVERSRDLGVAGLETGMG
jgi:hypothetical protein